MLRKQWIFYCKFRIRLSKVKQLLVQMPPANKPPQGYPILKWLVIHCTKPEDLIVVYLHLVKQRISQLNFPYI